MKFIDEYRDPKIARALVDRIRELATRQWRVMEICGGQTHTLMRYGIDELIAGQIDIVHGPGCPVCVTPLQMVDKAIAIASQPGVTFVTYGDMLRVPGSRSDLFGVRANGGDVRIAYSPMDALRLARSMPERKVVFFAVGFETTAPANGMAVLQADREGLKNFSMLVSQMLVPPAIRGIARSPQNGIQGFIGPGHVCTVTGYSEYADIARDFRVPVVIAGFEPVDLLEAMFMLVDQLENERAEAENQYTRSVTYEGNFEARRIMEQVFEIADCNWRGIGVIPASGLKLRPAFAAHDAEQRFDIRSTPAEEPSRCMAALVLQGVKKPNDCPAFANPCTPGCPLGAPMVSSEGVCSAYYQYKKRHGAMATR